MPLFQTSVLNKYLKSANAEKVEAAFQTYSEYFLNPEIQEHIRNLKEEQFQEGFIRELFVNVFGYILNPIPNFNITTELKNIKNAKKTDGAILREGKALAVIELKDTNTVDLDRVEIQAFGYKNNQPGCRYVITSNFEKLRFYIDDTTAFEEFNLFGIDRERFGLLFILLDAEGLLNDLPAKIKQESTLEEENVTKKLYKDYTTFKGELFRDLCAKNPNIDQLLLFKKSQKLLDRLLFIFFAEDKGLLPPNSISRIIEQWQQLKDLDAYKPLYERYQLYFSYIDQGHQGKTQNIFAYNGGLFKPDEILDTVSIDDELLAKHTLNLSRYDFSTEVDVNILGHIFEHSLNEIEEISAQLAGEEFDKSKTKRKKDGVFYTPKYITKYIVENTIGRLCEEKKEELGIIDEEYAKERKGRKKAKLKELSEKLETYQEWLFSLTICDPACGSGAFLNEAFDFLIKEHDYIAELRRYLFGESIRFEVEGTILEKNIYGVDLNEEAVEIAKLSLWLRSAKPGRTLSDLSGHLRVGNSLIDDPEVAGDKAFNWEKAFPEVFVNGGFDVVIGNPPYVRQEVFKEIKKHLKNKFVSYNSIADLYVYFIEKGVRILKDDGLNSFILPNKFLKANYGKEVRNFLSKKIKINLIFDFDDYPVFDDALTYPLIYIFKKSKKHNDYDFQYSEINDRNSGGDPIISLINNTIQVSSRSIKGNYWRFTTKEIENLLQKIIGNSLPLKQIVNNKIFRGVSTGCNDVFIIDEETKESLKTSNRIKKILTGKDVKRYSVNFQNQYLIFLDWDYDLHLDSKLKNYLETNKEKLESRPEVKEGRFNWWCLSRYGSKNSHYLSEPKIIYPRINNNSNFFLDETGEYFLSDNNFFIASGDKSLLAVLNSKVIFFFLKNICTSLQGGYYDFRRPYIEKIPIPSYNQNSQKELESLANEILNLQRRYSDKENNFIEVLMLKYPKLKNSKKLNDWHNFAKNEFFKELERNKIELDLNERSELLTFYNESFNEITNLKEEIKTKEYLIDQIVFRLFQLSPKEIEIIENS